MTSSSTEMRNQINTASPDSAAFYRPSRRRFSCLRVAGALIAISIAAVLPASSSMADWPYWRGPQFDGTAQAENLPEDWNPEGGEGSNLLWSRDDIGGPCT